jgi:hypothetical protein
VVEIPSEGGGIISTSEQIFPPKDLQIHAQTGNGGGSEDGVDIF